jgi:hypothetical protein
MSAKDLLHLRIEDITDEAAQLILDGLNEAEWSHVETLTPDQVTQLNRALQEDYEGRTVPHNEVVRRLNQKWGLNLPELHQ